MKDQRLYPLYCIQLPWLPQVFLNITFSLIFTSAPNVSFLLHVLD